jgi:hypothetical protein
MQNIQNNPYRIVGLLVGASAKEQDRQIRRLKQFVQAEQNPEEDFSFHALGHLERTLENVTDAASKLYLESDKMQAALFWFYIGNAITDEPAFDALKEGDIVQAVNIWSKQTSQGVVTKSKASAYNNLGTLYLSGALKGPRHGESILTEGIALKLKFLESEFITEYIILTTDETYKITKKELQIMFLRMIHSEVREKSIIDSNKFMNIIINQEFSAKDDLINEFSNAPINQIEIKLEASKNKRKASKENAIEIGLELYEVTADYLNQLKIILDISSVKYSSIADKVANEILQCSIDYFNHYQEKDSETDFFKSALNLAKIAQNVAIGKLAKDRIQDNLKTFEEMKFKEISSAIQVLSSIKDAYESNKIRITVEVQAMPLRYNQTINWVKVNEMIEKSIDWNKAVELVKQVIPLKNLEKIKGEANQTKRDEYKSLVEFFISKLNYTQANQVKYLCYWKTEDAISNFIFTLKILPEWLKWLSAIIIIIALVGAFGGEEALQWIFYIGAIIGGLALIGWLRN